MKCPKCHFDNPKETFYCGKCGAALSPSEERSISSTKTLQTPLMGLTPGTTLARRYQILGELGKGGMGVVYKAEDTKLKRTVALKLLWPELCCDPEVEKRFIQEAQVTAALVHPNIATVFEFDKWEGTSFLAMEYVEGQPLDKLLKNGPLALDQAIEFAIAVADALSLAHRKGIIHRDVKPKNIMVLFETQMRAARQIKVMDFGIAKLREAADLTIEGARIGTLAYMSPEQVRGEPVDLRTDIFSLGVVFYEMLSGKHPFGNGTEASVLYKIVNEEPIPLTKLRREIPVELEKIVLKALSKNPALRYQSMRELLADLANFQYNPLTLAFKSGPEKKSIAVLPFDDISPGKQNEYLADGMTEELIMTLSKNKQLRVIARASVMQYRGYAKDIREIGHELGISHVVEGSVRRHEDKLRVTAQLIDARDGSHLWADKYDGLMKDIFEFQDEVAQKVTGALQVELGAKPIEATKKAHPQTETYEYYLQGKFLVDVPTLPNLDRAVAMLKHALELDPRYADAFGSLANAYLWFIDTGLRPDPKYLTEGEEAARKALAIDKSQPDALYVLANLAMKKGQIEEAFVGFNKVLGVDPNQRDARLFKTILLFCSSYFDEALKEADTLLANDPFWPMGHWIHSTIRLHQGIFDAAMAEYETVVTELPSKLVWLALAYRYAGKMDKAREAAQKVKQYEPDGLLWPIAFAFLEGAEGKGKEILKYIDERVKSYGWNWLIVTYWVASFYAMAGELDEAFRWIERGIDIGCRNYRWFEIDPNLENLRRDPRYKEVLENARQRATQLSRYISNY